MYNVVCEYRCCKGDNMYCLCRILRKFKLILLGIGVKIVIIRVKL